MALPKRHSDRDEIAAVRVEAEKVEPGEEAGEPRRVAGRVMARRGMGKLVLRTALKASRGGRASASAVW